VQLRTVNPRDYNLHLVEAPNVEPEELCPAVRWKIKDLLDMKVEDAAIDTFPVPDDAGPNDVVTIDQEEFRYGRLLVKNAFGSELEPLGIGFRLEYWDGTEFVLNTDDSSTTLSYDGSEGTGDNRVLKYLSGTFTENLVEDTDDVVDPGESFIELAAVNGSTDVIISIFEGQTQQRSGVDGDVNDEQDDIALFTSAPGEGFEGTAIVEFDLGDVPLPFSLDFLSYDWRGVGETEDVNEDGDYSDNPRSRAEFGSYRWHDRVIN